MFLCLREISKRWSLYLFYGSLFLKIISFSFNLSFFSDKLRYEKKENSSFVTERNSHSQLREENVILDWVLLSPCVCVLKICNVSSATLSSYITHLLYDSQVEWSSGRTLVLPLPQGVLLINLLFTASVGYDEKCATFHFSQVFEHYLCLLCY